MNATEFLAELNEAGMSADFGSRSRGVADITALAEKWERLLQRLDFVSRAKGDHWFSFDDELQDFAPIAEPLVHDVNESMGFHDFGERVQIMSDFKERDKHTFRLGKDPRFKERVVDEPAASPTHKRRSRDQLDLL